MIGAPVDLYLILVAPIGVVIVVVVLRLIGGWRDAQLVDEEAARARLREQEPEFVAREVILAREGRGAVVRGRLRGRAAVALLAPLGDRFVVQTLPQGGLRGLAVTDASTLMMKTGALAGGTITMTFADPAAATAAQVWLRGQEEGR